MSKLKRHPVIANIFAIFLILLAILLLIMFVMSLIQISKKWNEVTLRHRTFLTFSVFFVFLYLLLTIFSFSSSYTSNGIAILVLFPITNLYVLVLQVLWRFSSKGKSELEDHRSGVYPIQKREKKKQQKGLDYFGEQYEINILRKGAEPLKETPDLEQPNISLMTNEDVVEINIKDTKQELKPVFHSPKKPVSEVVVEKVMPVPVPVLPLTPAPVVRLDPIAREKEELQKQLADIELDFRTVQLNPANNPIAQEIPDKPQRVELSSPIETKHNNHKPEAFLKIDEKTRPEIDNGFFIAENEESDKDEQLTDNREDDSKSEEENLPEVANNDSQLIEFSKADAEKNLDNEKSN